MTHLYFLNSATSATDVLILRPDGTAIWVPQGQAVAAATGQPFGPASEADTAKGVNYFGLGVAGAGAVTGNPPLMVTGGLISLTASGMSAIKDPSATNVLNFGTNAAGTFVPGRLGVGLSYTQEVLGHVGGGTMPSFSQMQIP